MAHGRIGDLVRAVDGRNVTNLSHEEVMLILRSEANTHTLLVVPCEATGM